MSKVNVLLSSYNGERYIRPLIDSVLHQYNTTIELLVRDDGSQDHTQQILKEYAEKGLLHWYAGPNLLPARSFLQLLRDSSPEADYYAFADQDDYWLPEKISVATQALEKYREVPALYFCKTQLTDEHLKPISSPALTPYLTFAESLVYEFIPGCTMVLNRKLRDIINCYKPDYLPMHDVWIYSVAQAIGAKVIFDPKPHILYRQHGDNTIGQGQGEWHEWKRRYKRLIHQEHSRSRRAIELEKGYATEMPEANRLLLRHFISGKKSIEQRIRLAIDSRYRCANKYTYRLFQLSVLLNIY